MTRDGARSGRGLGTALALCLAAASPVLPAAAQTRAGTAITNVAAAWHDGAAIPSTKVTTIVAERLDVALARSGDPGTVTVTLTNRGNGNEAFVVAAAVTSGSATIGHPVPAGAPAALTDDRTPILAPGATLTLTWPVAAVAPGTVLSVTARAATGSGAPGTIFANAGDGGGDAVVGATGAAASLSIPLTGDAAPTLEKSQAVRAPDGSPRAVRGAAVTYTLVARFAAPSADAEIVDPIPAGTAFVPGSLSLDGEPVADSGHVAGGQISVPLGAVTAGAARTLRFTVVIS